MVQLFSSFDTLIASAGHFFWQMLQKIQLSISISICPRVRSWKSRFRIGYICVAGLLNILLTIILLNFSIGKTSLTYLLMLPIYGAVVIIRKDKPVGRQPCNVIGKAWLCGSFIALTYLSVQLIHGSIVIISMGTSARSQPCSVFVMAGIFIFVGVRTRIRSRNLLPFPTE